VAFSRRTPVAPVVALQRAELELIERLVPRDRTAASTAVLAVAGIGAGGARRTAVLARVGEVARSAAAQGAISHERCAQIARHVNAALKGLARRIAKYATLAAERCQSLAAKTITPHVYARGCRHDHDRVVAGT
jgi:hypothetical protein